MKPFFCALLLGLFAGTIRADDKTGTITGIVTKSNVATSGAGEIHIYVDDNIWHGRILSSDPNGKNLLALCLSAQAQNRPIRIITEGSGSAQLIQQIILK